MCGIKFVLTNLEDLSLNNWIQEGNTQFEVNVTPNETPLQVKCFNYKQKKTTYASQYFILLTDKQRTLFRSDIKGSKEICPVCFHFGSFLMTAQGLSPRQSQCMSLPNNYNYLGSLTLHPLTLNENIVAGIAKVGTQSFLV